MLDFTFLYRLDGKTIYTAKHEFADDLDALDTAEQLAAEFEIEIWHCERFVARVFKGPRSLRVTDAHSS